MKADLLIILRRQRQTCGAASLLESELVRMVSLLWPFVQGFQASQDLSLCCLEAEVKVYGILGRFQCRKLRMIALYL